MDRIGIFIQARTGSTRLPNKMIRPFYDGLSMIEVILDRFIKNGLKDQTYLLTTNSEKDDVLVGIAERRGVRVFRGSEDDVLDRFVAAAEEFKVSKVVRVCADNPFLDISSIKYLINNASEEDDYFSFKLINGLPVILNHIGLYAEFIALNALKNVHGRILDKQYREHVTNYIHRHEQEFSVRLLEAPGTYEKTNIRLTCDTEEDFVMLQEIFSNLIAYIEDPVQLIREIEKNDKWMATMQRQIEKYGK